MKAGFYQVPRARYKLSPNEEAQLLKNERERLRKNRLLAVRQQAKQFSKKVLKEVRSEKERQLEILAEDIKKAWEEERQEKLEKLEDLYERNLKQVGGAHVSAVEQDIEGKEEMRKLIQEDDVRKTQERTRTALEKLHRDNKERYMEQTWHIRARKAALEQEKERAAEIAARPAPPSNPVDDLEIAKLKPVKFTDHDAFSTTHYHIPEEYGVVKEDTQISENAKQTGELEDERYNEIEAQKRTLVIERKEKARLRHIAALEKERLDQDYGHILHELSDLQKDDRIRRQNIVSNLPKQLFVPPSQRLDDKQDRERDMERAFEDLFLANNANTREMKELVLDNVHAPPTPSDELSITTVDEPTPVKHQQDRTGVAVEQESSQGDSTVRKLLDTTKQSDGGLKALLGRIKTQREGWVRKTNTESPAPTLTQYTVTSGSSEAGTLETGEIDSKSTVSSVRFQSDDLSTVTADEGTLTSSGTITEGHTQPSEDSQMLIHPMEVAARIRQTPGVASRRDMGSYLSSERLQQQQIAQENEQIKQEASERRGVLENQRQELIDKLRQLETKRLELMSRNQPAIEQQLQHPPIPHQTPLSMTQPQPPYYSQQQQPLTNGLIDSHDRLNTYPPPQPQQNNRPLQHSDIHQFNQHPNAEPILPPSQQPIDNVERALPADQSTLSSQSGLSTYSMSRVREYQERLLRRQGTQKEQMQQARQDLQRRVDAMLHSAKQDFDSVPGQVTAAPSHTQTLSHLPNFPRVSPLADVSPLGYFNDISPRTIENIEHLQQYQQYPPQQNLQHEQQMAYTDRDMHVLPHRLSLENESSDGSTSGYQQPQQYHAPVSSVSVGITQGMNSVGAATTSSYAPTSALSLSSYHSIGGDHHQPLSNRGYIPGVGFENVPIDRQQFQALDMSEDDSHTMEQTLPRSTGSISGAGGASLSPRSVASYQSSGVHSNTQQLPSDNAYGVYNNIHGGGNNEVLETSLQEKKEQLAEIQRRKREILERQRKHEEELELLRQRYDADFQSGTDDNYQIKDSTDSKSEDLDPSPLSSVNWDQMHIHHPLRPDLSTIIEVDSPEKTMVGGNTTTGFRPSLESEWQQDLSEGLITADRSQFQAMDEESTTIPGSSWTTGDDLPARTQYSGIRALDSQLNDSSFRPLQSVLEFSNNTTTQQTLDSSASSSMKSAKIPIRNWHDVLSESTLSSVNNLSSSTGTGKAVKQQGGLSNGQGEDYIQERGVPVGQPEHSSAYNMSQYFRQYIEGEEQQHLPAAFSLLTTTAASTSISQTEAPASLTTSSNQFHTLREDDTEVAESTMISSIAADDLPKDRDAFLEIGEGESPSPAQFPTLGGIKVTRPLSSTPARGAEPKSVMSQLRRSDMLAMSDYGTTSSHVSGTPSTLTAGTPYSGSTNTVTPSTVIEARLPPSGFTGLYSANTPNTVDLINNFKTPSTGGGSDLTQYTIQSGSSAKSEFNQNQGGAVSSSNELTQYPDYSTRMGESLTQHMITTTGDRSGLLPQGAESVHTATFDPRIALTYNNGSNNDSSELTQKLSSYLSDLSQYPVTTGSRLELRSSYGSSDVQPHGGYTAGSVASSYGGDQRSTTVRFAPGDPDVRFMSASSSEVGGSTLPATTSAYYQHLVQDNPISTISNTRTNVQSISRPTTIGENRDEHQHHQQQIFTPMTTIQTTANQSITPTTSFTNAPNTEASPLSQFNAPLNDLTKRIEDTMRKHEKFLAESKEMQDRQEEIDLQRKYSLEPLEFRELEETGPGITDEPDLTLISNTSDTPARQEHLLQPPSAANGADLSSSLLSFEQHEQSQGTPSDSATEQKTGDGTSSLLSFEKHESMFSSGSQDDRLPGMQQHFISTGETSSPIWLPLESDAEYTQQTPSGFSDISPSLNPATTLSTTDPFKSDLQLSASQSSSPVTVTPTPRSPSLTPTPRSPQQVGQSASSGLAAGAAAVWERDDAGFKPLARDGGYNDEFDDVDGHNVQSNEGATSSNTKHFISIPIGTVEADESGNDSIQGLSLQQVFEKKKSGFIAKSQQRKEAAAAKSKETQETRQAGDTGAPGTKSHMSKTMSNWKKSRGINKSAGTKIAKPISTTVVNTTSDDRKKAHEKMKEHTSQLYSRLAEVQAKKQEDDRKQKYANNREKAKEYNRKLQESKFNKKSGNHSSKP